MTSRKSKSQPARRRAPGVGPALLVLGGVALIGLAAFFAWRGAAAPRAAVEVQGAPRLKVDREFVDLGDVRLGQVVEVSFELTNVGDQPLRFAAAPYVEVVEGC